jgi:hypothetical protein
MFIIKSKRADSNLREFVFEIEKYTIEGPANGRLASLKQGLCIWLDS